MCSSSCLSLPSDDRGIPRTSAFFPGVIRSRGQLTYEGVQEALDHGGELAGRHPYLKDAEALAHLLLERRQARGSLDFDLPEAQFIVNRSTGEVEAKIKMRIYMEQSFRTVWTKSSSLSRM